MIIRHFVCRGCSHLKFLDLLPQILVRQLSILVRLKGHVPRVVVGELAGDVLGAVDAGE